MANFTKAIIIAAAVLSAGIAKAADTEFERNWREGTSTIRGLVGSMRGEFNFGVDYERRMGTMGVGGLVFFSAQNDKNETSRNPKQLVVAIDTPVHVIDRSPFDIYLAPGVAFLSNDSMNQVGAISATDKETALGPMMRIGMLYAFSPNWAAGLDFMKVVNWTNKDVPAEYNLSNVAVAYTL